MRTSESTTPQAHIIAVGSELLSSTRAETNSLFLTGVLNQLGIEVTSKRVVRDRETEIAAALMEALRPAEIVFLTGGLGPTTDDVTREAVASALGRRMLPNPKVLEHLEAFYRRVGRVMTENNRRQALVPEGAEILENPNGTAPGLFLLESERLIFLLPGPPRELQPMVKEEVIPRIQKHKATRCRHFRQVRVASMGESAVDAEVQPIYQAYPEISTTILSSPGVIDLLFLWQGPDDADLAEKRLDRLVSRIRARLGRSAFTDRQEELEEVVGRSLKARGLRLAIAESCTGGLISKLITDVPGSSEYFLGGVVSYSNKLKKELLEVPADSLEKLGAVSREVAAEMALGICRITGAEVGLSATGVAGPEGGSAGKPPGLVYVGLCRAGKARVQELNLPGDRNMVRIRTARFALDWLRRSLER